MRSSIAIRGVLQEAQQRIATQSGNYIRRGSRALRGRGGRVETGDNRYVAHCGIVTSLSTIDEDMPPYPDSRQSQITTPETLLARIPE